MVITRTFRNSLHPFGVRKFPEFQTRKGVGAFAAFALLLRIRGIFIQLHPSRRAYATNLPTADLKPS